MGADDAAGQEGIGGNRGPGTEIDRPHLLPTAYYPPYVYIIQGLLTTHIGVLKVVINLKQESLEGGRIPLYNVCPLFSDSPLPVSGYLDG